MPRSTKQKLTTMLDPVIRIQIGKVALENRTNISSILERQILQFWDLSYHEMGYDVPDNKSYRDKFTTTLSPTGYMQLKELANKMKVTRADIVEMLLNKHLDETKS